MKKKVLTLCLIVVLTASALGLTSASRVSTVDSIVKRVQSLAMFNASKWTYHSRTPNTDQIVNLLEDQGIPLNNQDTREQAIQVFMNEWAKRNPPTPNPQKLQQLLNRERTGQIVPVVQGPEEANPQIMSLAVPMEFPNSDTFDYCGTTVTTSGPLHNMIPAPGPRDNNTIWYDNTTPTLYNELYFGVGPKAGVIVHHPNLGTLDFRGNTMSNYYLEQSKGQFQPMGEVYPKWLQAIHSEGWYGQNTCSGGIVAGVAQDLVREAVNAINADNPNFAWETYDGNGDGIVDNFTVLHAGMGEEAGGGAQGEMAIWSHAWAIDEPNGKLACTAGSAGCPDRNIYVREYSMDPENIDVGVISEEFGHAAFGLPDLYATDAQGSISNWAIMEAGSWNGKLGGMTPAPFPLWFRYLVGWANPVVLDYTTPVTTVKVGQLSKTPKNTEDGIRINLPPVQVVTPNPLNTGKAWWSTTADSVDFTLAHSFDLTGATTPVFSFASYWSIEQDYDYGYVEVSTDNGATWTILQDTSGFMTNTNPNGTNQGWGLTGEGHGTVTFDLSAYKGQQVMMRLRYSTDPGTQWGGWWADDITLKDGATTLFSDQVENGADDWVTNAWEIVPLALSYPQYYLAEWRNASGFDKGLATPYTTIYDNPATTEWQVDRCPYTVPGMLLYLRNASQGFDYTLYDSIYDPPSYGPKFGLLVVDSHYWPLEWNGINANTGAHLRLNARCQPGNATFTLQQTKSFTADRADAIATGNIVETKTFMSLPPVSQFHDSLGYYPGLWYPGSGSNLYFWDAPASLVVPASGDYTTRITWLDKTPATDLYGTNLGDTILGTGNPRDDGVQYGVNIAVTGKAGDGSWGKITVWNATSLGSVQVKVNKATAAAGDTLMYQIKVKNISPAPQPFVLTDQIPANTTYVKGKFFNHDTQSIECKCKLNPNQTMTFTFWVKVNKGTPAGTEINNLAVLSDDTLGASASVITTVK